MIRRAAPALLLVPLLAACASGGGRLDELSPVTRETPAPPVFTTFASPCPAVGGRTGTELDGSLDTAIFRTVECGYGDRDRFPHVTSRSTINKPGNVTGAAERVTERMFGDLRTEAGAAAEDRGGLGDEAFLAVSYADNHVALVVRTANVLIRAVVTVDGDGDRKRELAVLRDHEPLVTELARALLAHLR